MFCLSPITPSFHVALIRSCCVNNFSSLLGQLLLEIMEIFATVNVAFITSLLLSAFRLITCQEQVQTPSMVSVTEGETATIDCQFDHSNLVALDWKKGEDVNSAPSLIRLFKGNPIPGDDPRFNVTANYSLTVTGTTQADSGIYWCQVTLQGVFQSWTRLEVLPVTTTSAVTSKATSKVTSKVAVNPTKSDPDKQISNNSTLYIIVGSCAGVVALAILVLVCYCCCCKSKSPNGYAKAKANPNTPV